MLSFAESTGKSGETAAFGGVFCDSRGVDEEDECGISFEGYFGDWWKKAGYINFTVQKIVNVQEEISLTFTATKLPRFGRSAPHPFLTINRVQQNKLVPVAKTNIARSTVDPHWKEIRVKSFRLCRNDFNLPLQFQVHSGDPSGNHRYIGSAKTNVSTILSGAVRVFPIINEKKLGKKGYVNSGEICVGDVKRSAPNSFLDYVKAGAEINCTLAVDMSHSNYGKIKSQSLHYLDPSDPSGGDNDYTYAIRKVCRVVGRYDKDQMFPIYGFGAKLPGNKDVSNCFPLTFDPDNEEVQGEDAIVETYRRAVKAVEPMEPTALAPVIRRVIKEIKDAVVEDAHEETQEMPSYQLLIIFTDGAIHDLTETIDATVDASFHPMSILVVGMGDPHVQKAGFNIMRQLDNPDEPLRSVVTGKTIKRDILNFMIFDEYKNATPNDFARGALAEVPSHFLSWVEMSGFTMKHLPEQNDDKDSVVLGAGEGIDLTATAAEIDGIKSPSVPPDMTPSVHPAEKVANASHDRELDLNKLETMSTHSITASTRNDLVRAITRGNPTAAAPLLQSDDNFYADFGSAEKMTKRAGTGGPSTQPPLQPPPPRPQSYGGLESVPVTQVVNPVVNPYGPAVSSIKELPPGERHTQARRRVPYTDGTGDGGAPVVKSVQSLSQSQQSRRSFRSKPPPAALEI